MTQSAKRSHASYESDAMDVDSGSFFSETGGASVVEMIQRCFESKDAFEVSSVDEKTQALALLGSVDFSLDALEKQILTSSLAPQIFACIEDDSNNGLAVEAAVCLKNLMTNESSGLGNKCTRRLYALCLFPVLARLMDKMVAGQLSSPSATLVEAVAVQVMCIASVIPASLPQITNSSLIRLLAARQEADSAQCALLQAVLVAVEDNKAMAEQLVSLCSTSLSQIDANQPLASVLKTLCSLQCACLIPSFKPDFAAICTFLIGQLSQALPDSASIQNEPQSVKAAFEVFELATEALELLISSAPKQFGKLLKASASNFSVFQLPFVFANFWSANFAAHFEGETNGDRVRLVRRLWSIIGNLFTLGEQLMLQCNLKCQEDLPSELKAVIRVASSAPDAESCVADEASGYVRARLVSWGDADFPAFDDEFFASFVNLFLHSQSPVVLSNACAMAALLIPYAPAPVQAQFCVFLNAALCTEPFDVDHVEVLLSAVDAVTGIFDPQSREWPAKPLSELKADVLNASQKLTTALSLADDDLKAAIKERISTLKSFSRIL